MRALQVTLAVVLVACGLAALAVIAVPLLVVALLSMPASLSTSQKAGIGEQARTIAYALRDEHVRAALDQGASRTRIAGVVGMVAPTAERLLAIGTDDASSGAPVLLRAERVGRSGAAVELAWGGTVGGGVEFGPPERPWVTCLRVELPATAIDATVWTVEDTDCPTFGAAVRKDAMRVHAGDFTARPLLRPPCYGTTGYCPGG